MEEANHREPASLVIIRRPVDWLALRERGPLSGPYPPASAASLSLEFALSLDLFSLSYRYALLEQQR
eukprot:scaffold19470_cov27-Attheya_sp.AAC.2